jgi:hypothetical protein
MTIGSCNIGISAIWYVLGYGAALIGVWIWYRVNVSNAPPRHQQFAMLGAIGACIGILVLFGQATAKAFC